MKHSDFTKRWPLNSAIYHAINGMLFADNKMGFRVSNLLYGTENDGEDNVATANIFNKEQLQKCLYKHIAHPYKLRIDAYNLTDIRLSDEGEAILDLNLFKSITQKNDGEDEIETHSGVYKIYPRSFYCNKCHDFIFMDKKNISQFKDNRCQHKDCKGYYTQIPMIKFCEKCGKLDEFYFKCENEYKHISEGKKCTMKFLWAGPEQVTTWRFKCDICNKEIDVLKIPCNHSEYGGPSRCKDKGFTKFKPISLSTSGGVVSPRVITMVDIPPMKELKHPKREQVILSVIGGKLEFLKKDLKEGTILEHVDKLYQIFNDPNLKEYVDAKLKDSINKIEKIISETNKSFTPEKIDMNEITNFHSLKGTFDNKLNTESYLSRIEKEKNPELKDKKLSIFKKFKIEDISYISKLKIISSCIGTINGPTFSYKENFIPHFNPLWDKDKKRIKVYCSPYETEGILIEINKDKIIDWINQIKPNKNKMSSNEVLLYMDESSEEYNLVYTLLHTLSHLIIKKSSIFTGIDADSCSEMILPRSGAILIYSTSTINIGGFGSLFENDLLDLFTEADFDMRKCIYDPICLNEKGSCFSCLYLPEFVCCNFNKLLDRDILLGSGKRFSEKFW